MPEYVYALHDFTPEHDDEISFTAGERIEVIERDEQYGDGWWQGRNLDGKLGLFPQAYTSASAPLPEVRTPTVPSALQPLQEEGPEETAAASSTDGAVMAATLTDVQEAIEQLGVGGDQDAARSFSFVSTRDGETDKDTETEDEGEGWHKDARKTLAERAQEENARRELEEPEEIAPPRPTLAPPIAVELSDESDAEEDEEVLRGAANKVHRHHKYTNSASTARDISQDDTLPSESLQPPISLTSSANPPLPSPPPSQVVTMVSTPDLVQPAPRTPKSSTASRSSRPASPHISPRPSKIDLVPPVPFPATPPTSTGAAANIPLPKSPSPASGSMVQLPKSQDPITPPQPSVPVSTHVSMPMAVPASVPVPVPASTPATAAAYSPAPVTSPASVQSPADSVRESFKQGHPSEWNVDQVVAWLRTKNIDEATCAKFIEHEITGDVLLELDVNLLKELDISAFGKRMRISNAIIELRRPSSFSSDQHMAQLNGNGFMSPGTAGVLSAESSPHTGDMPISPFSHRQEGSSATSGDHVPVGLGIMAPKARPAELTLSSPSDGALQPRAVIEHEEYIMEESGDDIMHYPRGVQSETEGPPSTTRRHFLGRSTESGSSNRDSGSKDSPLPSPNTPDDAGGMRHHMRGKRSHDGSAKGTGDRLSFFGNPLGKTRKPPPRYSIYDGDLSPPQQQQPQQGTERSTKSISRLYLGGKKIGRPLTPSGKRDKFDTIDIREKERGKDADKNGIKDVTRDPTLLRKRHLSTAAPTGDNVNTAVVSPKAKQGMHTGQSVLEQIGKPDLSGWLRKKGVRYNTWKLRYMVLKGPHLYYLRSNSRSETKIKGYIKMHGYKVIADENANPGKYGFRIVHDVEPSHFFSSEEQMIIREWMKALMKATIDRDFSKPVMSSCNIPTIPLTVAQAMSPTPRPPSPTARDATQKALRRENPNQLSSRDARVLMGIPSAENGVSYGSHSKLQSFFGSELPVYDATSGSPVPPRPARDSRKPSVKGGNSDRDLSSEKELVEWANGVLPERYRIGDIGVDLASGLVLMRLAESIHGKPSEPPIADSVFAEGNNLQGMFKLFDFLIDCGVKIDSVSMNDIMQGRPDKTLQMLKWLRAWEEKQKLAKPNGKGAGLRDFTEPNRVRSW